MNPYLVPDMQGWITRANLTAGNSNWILKRVTVKIRVQASPTEEPDAGKPHVRVCAGVLGDRRAYREMFLKSIIAYCAIRCIMNV